VYKGSRGREISMETSNPFFGSVSSSATKDIMVIKGGGNNNVVKFVINEPIMISQPTTSQPTTSQPTTSQPTTSQPTTSQPTTSQPTTSQPTTSQPTSSQPTINEPTMKESTLIEPPSIRSPLLPDFSSNGTVINKSEEKEAVLDIELSSKSSGRSLQTTNIVFILAFALITVVSTK